MDAAWRVENERSPKDGPFLDLFARCKVRKQGEPSSFR